MLELQPELFMLANCLLYILCSLLILDVLLTNLIFQVLIGTGMGIHVSALRYTTTYSCYCHNHNCSTFTQNNTTTDFPHKQKDINSAPQLVSVTPKTTSTLQIQHELGIDLL
jgi:hypothetical protein